MDPLTIGALVGGGLSAAGNLFGSSMNTQAQEQIAQENIAAQKEYAQHGLSWRVDDAKAAGINPLAALNFQGPSYSNVVGASNPGAGVAAAGQDIGRAVQSMQSPEARQAATQKTILDLESGQLDNDLKRTSLASALRRLNQPGTPPGLPALTTDYRAKDGTIVTLPSDKASAGYQAMGVPGSLFATGRFSSQGPGAAPASWSDRFKSWFGSTPWNP